MLVGYSKILLRSQLYNTLNIGKHFFRYEFGHELALCWIQGHSFSAGTIPTRNNMKSPGFSICFCKLPLSLEKEKMRERAPKKTTFPQIEFRSSVEGRILCYDNPGLMMRSTATENFSPTEQLRSEERRGKIIEFAAPLRDKIGFHSRVTIFQLFEWFYPIINHPIMLICLFSCSAWNLQHFEGCYIPVT